MSSADEFRPDPRRRRSHRSRRRGPQSRSDELVPIPLDSLIDALVRPAVPEMATAGGSLFPAARARSPGGPRRVWNLLVIVRTGIALGLLIPAALAWRGYQVVRGAGALVDRAEIYEAQQDWNAAARSYFAYLQFFPDDADVWIRMALSLDRRQSGIFQRAEVIGVFYEALARSGGRPALRRRLAELLLENERFPAAIEQAEELLREDPTDAVGLRVRGLASYQAARLDARQDWEGVRPALEAALASHPRDAEVALALAETLRQEVPERGPKAQAEADQVMQQLVGGDQLDSQTWLTYLEYCRKYGIDPGPQRVRQALDTNESSPELVAQAATLAQKQGETAAAEDFFQRLIEQSPSDPRGYLGLGQMRLASGDADEALAVWNRGLTQTDPDDLGLNLSRAELLISLGRLEEARAALAAVARRRAKLVPRPLPDNVDPVVAYLEGQVAQQTGRHYEAVNRFDVALNRESSQSVVAATGASIALLNAQAESFRTLGLPDRAAVAYEQAARLADFPPLFRWAAAEAWEEAEAWSLAAEQYQQVLSSLGQQAHSPSATLGWARCQLERFWQFPAEPRDWLSWDDAVANLSPDELAMESDDGAGLEVSPTAELRRLRAEASLLRENLSTALTELAELVAQFPSSWRAHRSLVRALDHQNRPESADELLAEFLARCPDQAAAWRYAIARASGRGQTELALARAIEAEKHATGATRDAWTAVRLAEQIRAGGTRQAAGELALLDRTTDTTVPLWQLRHRLTVDQAEWESARRVERTLHEIEGELGTAWRSAECHRMLATLASASSTERSDLERLAADLVRLRPGWPTGYWTRGMVAERLQQPELALENYRQANQQGSVESEGTGRYLRLLGLRRAWDELEQQLARPAVLQAISPADREAIVGLLLRGGRTSAALGLARPADDQAADARTELAWCRSLLAAGRVAEAETTLAALCTAEPGLAAAWLALADARSAAGSQSGVEELAVRAGGLAQLSASDRQLVSGRVAELLGRWQDARAAYSAVESPSEPRAAFSLVAEFAQNRHAELLVQARRKLSELDGGDFAARRDLLWALIQSGSTAHWNEAWEMAGGRRRPLDRLPPDAVRLRAELLAARGQPGDLGRAQKELAPLLADPELATESDRALAAELAVASGHWRQGADRFRELLTSAVDPTRYLDRWLRELLSREQFDEARHWLALFATAGPAQLAAVGLGRTAEGDWDETSDPRLAIEAALEERLTMALGPRAQGAELVAAALWLSALDEPTAAQGCFERACALDPACRWSYARWLLEQGRPLEAAKLAAAASQDSATPAAAAQLASLAAASSLTPSQAQQAFELVDRALLADPDHLGLLLAAGRFRLMTGNYAEALAPLRKAHSLAPDDDLAVAWLVIATVRQGESGADSSELIENAIESTGRSGWLVDILGQIALARDDPRTALAPLNEAIAWPGAPPNWLLHLALAQMRAGEPVEARQSLDRAAELGLNPAGLDPWERQERSTLESRLPR